MNNSDELKGAAAAPVLSGRQLGIAVLEALGLSSKDVTAVSLQMAAEGPATVSVSLVVRQPLLAMVTEELAQYELVRRPLPARQAALGGVEVRQFSRDEIVSVPAKPAFDPLGFPIRPAAGA